MKKDFRTPHDPFNYYNCNYNISGVKNILEIAPYYLIDDNCRTCIHERELIPPKCFLDECPWNLHKCGATQKYPTYETKRPWKGISIYINKPTFFWNLDMGFQFIFRTGALTGIELHHINGNETDHRIGNILPILSVDHKRFTLRLAQKRRKFFKLWNEWINTNKSSKFSKLDELRKTRNEIEDIIKEGYELKPCWDRIYTIVNEVAIHIKRDEIYEVPEEWVSNLGAFKTGRDTSCLKDSTSCIDIEEVK